MAAPEIDDESDDGFVDGFDGEEESASDTSDDFDVGDVDLGIGDGDGIVDGFDGVDGADAEDESGGGRSSASESGGSGGNGESIGQAIEDGLARTAAIGLEGREKERVQTEMQEIASEFKIGYFGERTAKKYLKTDLENLPPEYGLAAAMVAFAVVAIHKRPDGEERVNHAVSVVKEKFSGGDDPAPEPHPEPQRQPPQQPQRQPQQQPQPTPAEQVEQLEEADVATAEMPNE